MGEKKICTGILEAMLCSLKNQRSIDAYRKKDTSAKLKQVLFLK